MEKEVHRTSESKECSIHPYANQKHAEMHAVGQTSGVEEVYVLVMMWIHRICEKTAGGSANCLSTLNTTC